MPSITNDKPPKEAGIVPGDNLEPENKCGIYFLGACGFRVLGKVGDLMVQTTRICSRMISLGTQQ